MEFDDDVVGEREVRGVYLAVEEGWRGGGGKKTPLRGEKIVDGLLCVCVSIDR